MSKAILGARIVLGLIFTLFGINYFVPFLPQPELSEAAGAFFGGLAATGYMLPMVKITELVGGVMLLAGFFVPLALALLAPVVVNIVAFHLFLDLAGIPISILVLVLELFLAWSYRGAFAPMLDAKTRPNT
jgi:uncharacterized membrane protein YphA (DoxX/SURF4 family)